MPWRFSAHGSPAEVRGRAHEFFQSDTGFIHQNLSWKNIRDAGYVYERIERYLAPRAPDERVTVKASRAAIFAAPITTYPEPAPAVQRVPVTWKYNPLPQPAAKRAVPARKPAHK